MRVEADLGPSSQPFDYPERNNPQYAIQEVDTDNRYLKLISTKGIPTQIEYIFREEGTPRLVRRKTDSNSLIILQNSDPESPVSIRYSYRRKPEMNHAHQFSLQFGHHLQFTESSSYLYGGGDYDPISGQLISITTGNHFSPANDERHDPLVFSMAINDIHNVTYSDKKLENYNWSYTIYPKGKVFILSLQQIQSGEIKRIELPLWVNARFSRDAFYDDREKRWANIPLFVVPLFKVSTDRILLANNYDKVQDVVIPNKGNQATDRVIGPINMRDLYSRIDPVENESPFAD